MPIIDLNFSIIGTTIPLDHGYSLFSALCRVVPQLHGDTRIGVHPIRGRQAAPGVLSLIDSSRIRLRLPSEEIAPYIAVAGTELELDGHRLQVGIPRVECLTPAPSLGSRLVTFRGVIDPTLFEANIRRHLEKRKISGEPSLVAATRAPWTGQPMRRVLKVKDKRVIGYSLRIHGLKSEDSISLQEEGLGGRRRMGCGVFQPVSRPENCL
ncbi:type I-MYXAN CRISPR-associated protein Cas6/Cmx6 [Singulisphaera sp. Ch08]|uniref:Type I-MYXAN CRISPR-associated protein Cas6/Cmx6 n=1 Tax=Singulisphaera sp. Ch08 TaxID=3120278 RepID=A0AAU7CJE1_9BACT